MIYNKDIKVSMLSGGTSGLITDIVYFPLDTIKTRLQVK